MRRLTRKQKAELSLCLSIFRTWTKFSASEKPSILNTCWRVVPPPIKSQSTLGIDQDILDKEIFDAEIAAAASAQNLKRKVVGSDDPDDLPGPSGEVYTSDSEEDQPLAFAKSLFLKNKGKKGKCTSTPKSTPKNAPRNAPKSLKDGKKAARKKVKAAAADEPTVLSFLERAQERDEAFMERMAEAERESRREQQKFSMDALKMLGNILKDVANGKD